MPIPARDGPSVLLDCGANADARAEHLLQFAHMGAIFAEEILGIPNPEVRLLSIGEEPEKGNQLDARGARAARRERRSNFRGNTEGRDLLAKAADVVVTDGFTGNVALKTLEGTIRTVIEGLRDEITATARGKLGGLLIRPGVAAPAPPARPGHLRRRLPARPARARRDRARQLVADGDRERDPPRRPRCRARRRRPARRAACRQGGTTGLTCV